MPTLPRAVWWVLTAELASAVGTGLTTPFLALYLASGRGLDTALVGLVISETALAGMLGNLFGGTFADRFGPRPVLLGGLTTAAVATLGWSLVDRSWIAFVVAAVVGLSEGVIGPAHGTLIAERTTAEQRSTVFGIGFTTLNLGLGLGGMLAALVLHGDLAAGYRVLIAANAGSFVVAALIIAVLPRGGPVAADGAADGAADCVADGAAAPAAAPVADGVAGGYRRVFRDPVFTRLWLLILVLVAAGYAQLGITVPLILVERGGLAPGILGAVFTVNTVTIVVAQLFVLRVISGRRRSRAVLTTCLVWAATWLLIAVGAMHADRTLLTVLALIAAGLFAVGETLLAPTLPAIVNDIAPDALRGRYNGALMFAYTGGFVAGPALSGMILDRGLVVPLLFGLVAVCAAAAVAVYRIERYIPAAANLGTTPEAASVTDDTVELALFAPGRHRAPVDRPRLAVRSRPAAHRAARGPRTAVRTPK